MSDLSYGFFPTGKELFSGVKWIKEHPVVATAAAVGATAISIVTYFRATTPMTSYDHQVPKGTLNVRERVVSWCDVHVKTDDSRPQESTKDSRSHHKHEGEGDRTTDDDEDDLLEELQTLAIKARVPRDAGWDDDRNAGNLSKQDLHNASPQWGWYVAITPPTDGTPGTGLPRAIADPIQGPIATSASLMGLKRTQSARLR
ncbi:hypothetical protein DYB28_009420 [Aphanomyces astaci]|uniref:Uncharacterized protein n=1 Tax=Aphanomyces astaci TaxID=112090 RepID=A0A9X8HEH8_APHAT|nr:hypothetical protein DYB28_009420 [Aphanomyces astaci]